MINFGVWRVDLDVEASGTALGGGFLLISEHTVFQLDDDVSGRFLGGRVNSFEVV